MSDDKPNNADEDFLKLSEELQDELSRKQIGRMFSRLAKGLLEYTGYAYVAFLLFLMVCTRSIGEKNLTLAFILYLPQVAWLLPMPLFLLPALIWQRKLFLTLILTTGIFIWSVMGYRFGSDKPVPLSDRGPDTITVLSYNHGQQGNKRLQRFKNFIQPDIMLIQEGGIKALYKEGSGYDNLPFVSDQGEFALLSIYPIVDTSQISFPFPPFSGKKQNIATRYEIDWDGRRVAIYNVHLPTPRDNLLYMRKGAFLYGILGIPGTPLADKKKSAQIYWDTRIALSLDLIKKLKDEELPMIVVGDFNAPHFGYNHRLFDSFLNDAHKTSGSGMGYTFPGVTRNPLSLGGPWMRLDYIFYNDKWKSLGYLTEKKRPSQHRAVAATLRLKSKD